MATAPHNHLKMVDDLEYFNNYPWGTLSYTTTIRSLKSGFEHRESMALNKLKSYSVYGFPLAFMIWGFETIPSLGQAFGKKLPDMAFPRILNWHISQVPRFEKATELFDHRDYPVHGLMNVTEFECAYIGKIAWDVHYDTTPYSVAPAVRDKPPQESHGEKDEGVPLTSSGRSKKQKQASVESKGNGGRRRMGDKPTDQPSSSTIGVAAHVHYYTVAMVNWGVEMEDQKMSISLTSIDLSNKGFDGEVPSNICNLQALVSLNLSSNRFTGAIPSSIRNMGEIESLDLSNNKLFGRIRQRLTKLSFLGYLNLSQNQLTRPIPQGGQLDTFSSSSFE
ncbi:uncharacterized protein LOC132799693 [Ziziphus jujuba]|uniref:Uncharacterized protein LOC132799693 n=1 Tax=Ziziphus jujuba TaxID=326968 RepID=A0ABM3ZUK8_ZIZJJ|nr:uncharacterized protein LOC132799693 [Ziziphus jujuba]